MGITDCRYSCAFLHTITDIPRISENKHLIGGEFFSQIYVMYRSESHHVLHDLVASFFQASSGLLMPNLQESIQRPWDVGSLLGEDAFPNEERLLWSCLGGGGVWLWSSLGRPLDSWYVEGGSRTLCVRARS